uniref:Uncharacterized protein n=1 Tax=Tanacetum cinerariifolium TaxID=118510 RepID=A0A699GSQ3_TANCI|nr:hypothetical protein [Tanacetum cinerariifolium]
MKAWYHKRCSACNLEAIEESPVPRCKNHDPQGFQTIGVNDKRSAIMHSRHSNVEHQDIVATVQQVLSQSIVALPDNRHILLRHTTPTALRKTNNNGCCVANVSMTTILRLYTQDV